VAITAGLLHDIIEEDADENIDEYVRQEYKLLSKSKIIKKVIIKRMNKNKIESIYRSSMKKFHGDLLSIFDNVLENGQHSEHIGKMRDIYKVVKVLTRSFESDYYDDIGEIFRSDLSYENKARAILIKIKDRENNIRTMIPRCFNGDKIPLKSWIKNLVYDKKRDNIQDWIDNNQESSKELEQTYLEGLIIKKFSFFNMKNSWKMLNMRITNKICHILRDQGPYRNSDKIYACYKNIIMQNQTRDFYNDLNNLVSMEKLKNYMQKYTDTHPLFSLDGLSDIKTGMDFLELSLRLDRNDVLKKDISFLKDHLIRSNIYYSDEQRVGDSISSLQQKGNIKSNENDLMFHLWVQYNSSIFSKYNLKDDDEIEDVSKMIDCLNKFEIRESLLSLARYTKHSLDMSVNHSKIFHIHPKKVIGERRRLADYEGYDSITYSDAGDRYDGFISRRMDPKIRKKPVTGILDNYKDWMNRSRNLQEAMVLREINRRFISSPDFVLRGLGSAGPYPYGFGFRVEEPFYNNLSYNNR